MKDVGNSPSVFPVNTKGSGAGGTDGTWTTSAGDAWTAGFFAGTMWMDYQRNARKTTRLNKRWR